VTVRARRIGLLRRPTRRTALRVLSDTNALKFVSGK
jgi:hypothetical protein